LSYLLLVLKIFPIPICRFYAIPGSAIPGAIPIPVN